MLEHGKSLDYRMGRLCRSVYLLPASFYKCPFSAEVMKVGSRAVSST